MKRSKVTEEQVIGILREQEAGAKTVELCRRHGISKATFYAWKAKFGGVEAAAGGAASGPSCAERPPVAKVVMPAARREAVAIPVERHEMSERRGRKKASGTWAPAANGGCAERALLGRFRPRPVRQRQAIPDRQCDRRCHEGVPGRRAPWSTPQSRAAVSHGN
ncbi:hypothetical protein CKO24_14360 [Rhodothalassium salexigens DSM 2132]|nr:hypothetical protein [Rhodothalassium salexigens DSM 2132]